MSTTPDTGIFAEVPPLDRLDEDGGQGSDALEGGADDEDLATIYANPGELIEEDLG